MSDEVLDDVMLKGNCKGKADAIVNCQCSIETAPKRCEQAELSFFCSVKKQITVLFFDITECGIFHR